MARQKLTDEERKKRHQECQRRYYQRNKEKIKANQRRHYEKNRERINERHKAYNREHYDVVRKAQQKHYKEHREELREYFKKYYQDNKELLLERQRERNLKAKRKRERLKNVTYQLTKQEKADLRHKQLMEHYKVPDDVFEELTSCGDRKVYLLIDKESLEPVRAVTIKMLVGETGKTTSAVKHMLDIGEYDGCYICEE